MGMKKLTINTVVISFLLAGFQLGFQSSVNAAEAEGVLSNTPMPWAYAINTPDIDVPFAFNVPRTVPDSELEFVFTNPRNLYRPPDWHPQDHPLMPEIVASGREPAVFACAYCHLPNGQGRPENASIAGLPQAYIIQQMADWRAGLRRSSEPLHGPASAMQAIGFNATEDEVAIAAAYFSSLVPRKWIRVVETDTVPETVVAGWMYIEADGGSNEAIGNRILEMPEDLELTELRDDHSGFIAYVPVGSIARGEQLVRSASDAVCTSCHGEDLRGLGPVPPLAGRSPSYIARALFDLQEGNRRGLWSPLMEDAVKDLSTSDMLAIAAYLASLEP